MVPEWTIHMHINTHTHIHTLLYIATHTLISIQMTFKILLSLFSRLSSFCQRFYPQVLCYRKRAQIHTHTLFTTSFYWFPSQILWQALRNHCVADAIYVVGPGRASELPFGFVLFHLKFFIMILPANEHFFYSAPKFRWQFADGRQSRCFVSSIYELKFNS